jgi:hypothetical protein
MVFTTQKHTTFEIKAVVLLFFLPKILKINKKMKKIIVNLLFVCCLFSTLFAQTTVKTEPLVLKTTTATLTTIEKAAVDTVFAKYELLSINFTQLKAMLRTLQGDKTAIFALELPNMPKMTVEVQPNDLRSPNFIASINGSQENLPIEMKECITFKGKIKEDAASEVLLTITDNLLMCNFTFAKIAYTIEPCSNYETTGKEFVFYANSAKIHKENSGICGNMEHSELSKQKVINPSVSTQRLQGCKIAEVALDADYYFSEEYKANAYGIMMSNFISVAELYRRDLNIQLLIVYTNIFTVHTTCPYTKGDPLNDFLFYGGTTYLSKAKDYWITQNIDRDLVHIFSGRKFLYGKIGGEVIKIGAACIKRNDDIGFTSSKADFSTMNILMGHEIGHLFGGQHQGCAWAGIFGDDTIMCEDAVDNTFRFSNGSKEEIGNFINTNISCFDNITGLGDKIEGADFICDNTPNPIYTFAIPSTTWTPWGNSFWTSTGNITVTPRGSLNPNEFSSSVEVAKTGDGIATLTFSYYIDGVSCPAQVFTKTIYLGKPTDFELRTEENSQNCRDISPIIYMVGSENAKQVRWEYMHPITRVWTSYGTLPYSGYFIPDFFTIPEFSDWYRFARQGACISFSFRAIPINDCGENAQGTGNTSAILTFCKGGGAMYCRQAQTTTNETLELKLSPNPAEDGMVEISLIGKGYEVVNTSEPYEVVIYNTLGQVVKTFTTKYLQNKVDVQDLKVGIYIVKIVYQDQILQNKLMINR